MHLRQSLPPLSRFTFGTGRLEGGEGDFANHVKVARAAMEAGVWFHSSSDYGKGGVFKVLRTAFAEAPSQRPPCIIKVYCPTAEKAAAHIDEILANLGVDRIEIAQLCCWSDFAEDFRTEGPRFQLFQDLQRRGVIGHYVTEVFANDSANAVEVAKADLVDGFIYYYNLIDRQISSELDALLRREKRPVLALRTVAGMKIDFDTLAGKILENPGDERLHRLTALHPLFLRSGCRDWAEFNVRFLLTQSPVRTTIGATQSLAHLERFLEVEREFQPLDDALMAEIAALHAQWFAGFGHPTSP